MLVEKANYVWLHFNLLNTWPLFIMLLIRLRKPHKKHIKLDFIDYYCTAIYAFTTAFYIFDIIIKSMLGYYSDTCEQAFFVHHAGAVLLMTPMVYNCVISWGAIAIGLMHSILFRFPDVFWLNAPYIIIVLLYHYGLYQVKINLKVPLQQISGLHIYKNIYLCNVSVLYIIRD